jgi:hypothetical protein
MRLLRIIPEYAMNTIVFRRFGLVAFTQVVMLYKRLLQFNKKNN